MLQSKTNISKLDREITFIQPIIEQGTSGEDKIVGWELINSEPNDNARKVEEGGNTGVQADRITYNKQTSWVIRSRDDLTVKNRLVWDTKVYEILNLSDADEGRGRFMTILTNLLDNEYFT